MSSLLITKLNESYVRLDSRDEHIIRELYDIFTFEVPAARFMRKYPKWNGQIHLLNFRTRQIYMGLVHAIKKYCASKDYEVFLEGFGDSNEIPLPELNLSDSKGNPITPYDYQLNALDFITKNDRGIILSPTASGKSLIIYSAVRARIKLILRKILIIVPTTALVEQLHSDFNDYSFNDSEWNNDAMVHRIYQGKEKFNFTQNVVISTYQSLAKLDASYFDQFEMIICDECHTAKSQSITSIMQASKNAKYRYGFTGTLQDTEVHQLVLAGLFGKTFKTASTLELIEQKRVAPLKINSLILTYSKESTKTTKDYDYQQEIDFIVTNQKRNKFICNLAEKLDGNTLILYSFVSKHGDELKRILDASSNKEIHYIHGKVDTIDRETTRQIAESQNNLIILGSYSILSTGTNIKNLHNIIFASPSKSKIRVLQSIGRTLRLNTNKETATLYDICDDMRHNKKINYAFKHFIERLKLYQSEGFEYTTHKINF